MTEPQTDVEVIDYKSHLRELRRSYIEATPKQRLYIANQRINETESGPNKLVSFVSAVEGFARSLMMHHETSVKANLSVIYPKYRNIGPLELVELYLKNKIAVNGVFFFGEEVWEKFKYAVEYRNLLAHECTYLGQDIYPDLIDSCNEILSKLASLEKSGKLD